MKPWQWIIVGVAVACWSTNSIACSLQDIEVRQANWHRDGDYVHIVGEIYNSCSEAVGVELQAVFRDKAKQIVIVTEFWPASTRNIVGRKAYQFGTMEHSDQPIETMTLRVIDVRRWNTGSGSGADNKQP